MLSSGDGGLEGGVEAVREGQYHPHLPPLLSYSPSTFPPPLPTVPVMSHGGDSNGGEGGKTVGLDRQSSL